MKSLCATCTRRGSAPGTCLVPLAETTVKRQPVSVCPWYRDNQGREQANG